MQLSTYETHNHEDPNFPIIFHLDTRRKEEEDRKATPEKIIEAVAKCYSVTPKDILSNDRSREYSVPRQLAIYLTRELCSFSTTKIGEAFKRDHSTVMHACKKAEEMMEQSLTIKLAAEQIKSELGNGK